MEGKPHRPLVHSSSGEQLLEEEGKMEGGGQRGREGRRKVPHLNPLIHLPHEAPGPQSARRLAQAEPHDRHGRVPALPLDLGTPALRRQLPSSPDLLVRWGETGHEVSPTLTSGHSMAGFGFSDSPAQPLASVFITGSLFRVNLIASHSGAPVLPSGSSLSSERATLQAPAA